MTATKQTPQTGGGAESAPPDTGVEAQTPPPPAASSPESASLFDWECDLCGTPILLHEPATFSGDVIYICDRCAT